MSEVLQILTRDESERFPQAQQYLSRLEGVDALSLRATLEMLWADGQLTLAVLAREQANRRRQRPLPFRTCRSSNPRTQN